MSDKVPSVKCPDCGKEWAVNVAQVLPSSQIMRAELKFTGPYLSAITLGEFISNLGRVFAEMGSAYKTPVLASVKGIGLEDGKVSVEFVITQFKTGACGGEG